MPVLTGLDIHRQSSAAPTSPSQTDKCHKGPKEGQGDAGDAELSCSAGRAGFPLLKPPSHIMHLLKEILASAKVIPSYIAMFRCLFKGFMFFKIFVLVLKTNKQPLLA